MARTVGTAVKLGTLVVVTWLDAEADASWTARREVVSKPAVVHSAGYVLVDNDDGITVAGDVGDKLADADQTVNRTLVIPRGMIVKVRRLPA